MSLLPTIILLVFSNCFMTAAWYGHLKFTSKPLWIVIVASWLIAFFEYVLQVPANRLGSLAGWSPAQLKIVQEVLAISVFVVFDRCYFGGAPRWNEWLAFGLILLAVVAMLWPELTGCAVDAKS